MGLGVSFCSAFLLNQYAVNNHRQDIDNNFISQTDDLISQTERIENLIRTMPPEAFLKEFSETFQRCNQLTKEYIKSSERDKDTTEYMIRTVLSGIITLAQLFDKGDKSARYAANIMLFEQYGAHNPIFENENNVKFLSHGADLKKLKGLLVLNKKLSATSEEKYPEEDSDIANEGVILPVPNDHININHKYVVLPGAPLAFLTYKANQYSDPDTLDNWMKEEGDFLKATRKEVKDYFASDCANFIKSFVSLPIPSKSESVVQPTAILNIHKNETNLLDEQDQLESFTLIMCPFFDILNELLCIR